MKKLTVGVYEAKMVDDKGNIHISRKESGVWVYKGRAYNSPLDAFKEVEHELQKRVSGL